MQRALQLAPDRYIARLDLGICQERLGERFPAMTSYFRAILMAQQRGAWMSEATTPPEVLRRVGHAMRYLQSFKGRLYDEVLAPVRAHYGDGALSRVAAFLEFFLEHKPPAYTDPRQRPKAYFFPGLLAQPYFSSDLFPWIPELEARTEAIREEMLQILGAPSALEPFLRLSDQTPLREYLQNASGPPTWDACFFHRHGQSYPENLERCPKTVAALEQVPLTRVRGNAPEVLFSVLTPGTHIMPHHGSTNTRTVVHLPLLVSGDCALKVGGELHAWQEGRCVAFDDSYEHEAWNFSDKTRVVLILDVWNPYLSEAERAAIAALVPAIRDTEDAFEAP